MTPKHTVALKACVCLGVVATALYLLSDYKSRNINQTSDVSDSNANRASSTGAGARATDATTAKNNKGAGYDLIDLVIPSNRGNAARAEKRIAEIVASGMGGSWGLMRHELLDLGVPREDAIHIARSYLNHSIPIIRYAACETLYRLGDSSGFEVLVSILRNKEPIPVAGVESDLRAWAAMTLAEYRDTRGASDVAALYAATKDLSIRGNAVKLGAKEVIPDLLKSMEKRVWENNLTDCAQLRVAEAKPIVVRMFEDAKSKPSMRVSAANAMLQLGESGVYLDYLIDVVNRYTGPPGGSGDKSIEMEAQDALRALGVAPRNDTVQKTLEQSLSSKNVTLAAIAMVQLRVNYPESAKARQHLVDCLNGSGNLQASDVFKLAAMSNEPEIRSIAAGRNSLLWQKYALHEKDWDKGPWLRGLGIETDRLRR